jgi:hypothetical protein
VGVLSVVWNIINLKAYLHLVIIYVYTHMNFLIYFLTKNSKGDPCCAKIILNKKEEKDTYKQEKSCLWPEQNKKRNYLYMFTSLINCSFLSTLNMLAWSIASSRKPSFQRGATSIKNEIIALLLDLPGPQDENFHEEFVTELLPSFIMECNCWPNLQLMLRCLQQSWLKGQEKKRWCDIPSLSNDG